MTSVDRPIFGELPREITQPQPPTPNKKIDYVAFRDTVLGITQIVPRLHAWHQLTLDLPETPRPTATLRTPVTIFPEVGPRQGEGGLAAKERVDSNAFRRRALFGSET